MVWPSMQQQNLPRISVEGINKDVAVIEVCQWKMCAGFYLAVLSCLLYCCYFEMEHNNEELLQCL